MRDQCHGGTSPGQPPSLPGGHSREIRKQQTYQLLKTGQERAIIDRERPRFNNMPRKGAGKNKTTGKHVAKAFPIAVVLPRNRKIAARNTP
jgi:hypothetical protein